MIRWRGKRWKINWFRLVIVAMLLYTAVVFVQQQLDMWRLQSQLSQVQAEIDQQQLENRTLERRLERMDHPSMIEQLARDELGMIQPGEITYRFSAKGH